MSWIERLENVTFEIKTGDGKTYKPLWKNGSKETVFNATNYNFIDVEGGFTERKRPQASKFPLVFWFQGDDNIDLSEAFEQSAKDKRPWEIKHPFYGNISGQPVSLRRNDTAYNITEITVDFWESINEDYPNSTPAISDVIVEKTNTTVEAAAALYEAKATPEPRDISKFQDFINKLKGRFNNFLEEINFSEYQAKVNKALSEATNIVETSTGAISAIQDLELSPALFPIPIQVRLGSLLLAFEDAKDIVSSNPSVNDKLLFETQAATIVASMSLATTEPQEGDYVTSIQIQEVTQVVVDTLADYLNTLDSLQVNISESLETYIPDVTAQTNLYDLVAETSFSLFSLAFNAKQERTVELNRDSNIILLTHKYLGLDVSDENLETFRQINGIKSDELFRIKKGRTIKYFV